MKMQSLLALVLALLAGMCVVGCPQQPEQVAVPDVVGQVKAEAETAITGASLAVGAIEAEDSEVAEDDVVLSQTPEGGTLLEKGKPVALRLAVKKVRVPDLSGKTLDEAQRILARHTLLLGTVTEQFSTTVPEGQILAQDPVVGTKVRPLTKVNVIVSKGSGLVLVPDVVGLTQAAAQTAITTAGLSLGAVSEEFSATAPIGQVMDQTPAGGTQVSPGSAVSLVVSKGPAPVNVPNVVGLSEAQARTAITSAQLVIGVVDQAYSATVPTGNVMNQSPAGGTQVLPGVAVNLVISKGPAPVTVPDVFGLSEVQARTAISGAGLTMGTISEAYSGTVPNGNVMNQAPSAGTQVLPGASVNITVSKGPEPVSVPNVVGLSEANARTAITTAQLTVGTVDQAFSATVPEGDVISQSPLAGTSVLPGAEVSFTVSKGPEPEEIFAILSLSGPAREVLGPACYFDGRAGAIMSPGVVRIVGNNEGDYPREALAMEVDVQACWTDPTGDEIAPQPATATLKQFAPGRDALTRSCSPDGELVGSQLDMDSCIVWRWDGSELYSINMGYGASGIYALRADGNGVGMSPYGGVLTNSTGYDVLTLDNTGGIFDLKGSNAVGYDVLYDVTEGRDAAMIWVGLAVPGIELLGLSWNNGATGLSTPSDYACGWANDLFFHYDAALWDLRSGFTGVQHTPIVGGENLTAQAVESYESQPIVVGGSLHVELVGGGNFGFISVGFAGDGKPHAEKITDWLNRHCVAEFGKGLDPGFQVSNLSKVWFYEGSMYLLGYYTFAGSPDISDGYLIVAPLSWVREDLGL